LSTTVYWQIRGLDNIITIQTWFATGILLLRFGSRRIYNIIVLTHCGHRSPNHSRRTTITSRNVICDRDSRYGCCLAPDTRMIYARGWEDSMPCDVSNWHAFLCVVRSVGLLQARRTASGDQPVTVFFSNSYNSMCKGPPGYNLRRSAVVSDNNKILYKFVRQ
jgi:hypothetical protein